MTIMPKTIHYCWFGGGSLGARELACMESWKKYCPDYEVVRWDESKFDVRSCGYVSEAYDANKWAFVSDYVRLWVLVNFGGIYMDVDVEVVKSLDRFLSHDAFSGFESATQIPTGIMGCKKSFSLFESLLHDYDDRHFILDCGEYDTATNVVSITKACLERGFVPNNEYQVCDGFALYPSDWFCPKSPDTGLINMTENTYTIHHFSGSWIDEKERQIRKLKHIIMQKHPGMNEKAATAIAKISYGIRYKDFAPFIESVKANLSKGNEVK